MAADSKGNDTGKVDVVITAALAIAPYDAENVLAPEQGGGDTVDLPEAYVPVGLIKSDGGANESIDQEDAIEFLQDGYSLASDPTMSIQFGLAEFNKAVRLLTTGKMPDENGMISVDTYTPDTKWLMYYEEVYKNGRVRRLNGVAQVTTTEIDQTERGSVKGRNVTLKWLPDPLIGNGTTTKFNEWHWPADDDDDDPVVEVASINASKDSVTGTAGTTDTFTVDVQPATATDKTVTATSNHEEYATATVEGTTVTVHFVAEGNATITVKAGGKTDTVTAITTGEA